MQSFHWRSPCIALALVAMFTGARVAGGQTPDFSAFRSPEEIRSAVEELREQDVAWRQVQWKTCLIDGLAESLRTKKPLMLWIFIDRPIDDERC